MTLHEKQTRFPLLLSALILYLDDRGYEVTLGEAWRSPETAELYAQEGKGVAHSLHCLRIAIDLNLFRSGVFLRAVSDYKEAGEYWEGMSTQDYVCCWGGRFVTMPDAYHFSIAHDGVK